MYKLYVNVASYQIYIYFIVAPIPLRFTTLYAIRAFEP